jgi:RNA recognition motif-containing protein
MSQKIYVGNLGFTVTNEELRSKFEAYGQVSSAKIITDRDTGRSKGFGFVEMASQDAQAAINALNGSDHDGRSLTVNEAKPMQPRDGGSRFSR